MNRFFRHIRQQSYSKGKIEKYLKYAIGEIILVVIGILVAVQINSAYTNKSQHAVSENLLLRMIAELEINSERLHYLDLVNYYADSTEKLSYSKNEKLLYQSLSILTNGVTEKNIQDLIDSHMINRSNYNLEISVYEEMINTGNLYKVNSNSLINDINTYYRLINKEDNYNSELIDRAANLLDDCANWNYFLTIYKSDKERAIYNNEWLFNYESEDYKKLTNYVDFAHTVIKRNRQRIAGINNASSELIEAIKLHISN